MTAGDHGAAGNAMSHNRRASDDVAISAGDLATFHRNAPAALARRGAGFVAETLAGALQSIIVGAVPIAGLLWFDWSAAQWFLFLLVGAWVGILCDLARLKLAEPAVLAFGKTYYDDWHVWVVVEALRRGADEAPKSHIRAKWDPWSGVFVDFAAGGLATVLLSLMLRSQWQGDVDGTLSPSLLASLAVMAGYQVLTAAWEIVRHRRAGEAAGPLKAAPGMRGLGLFLLVFVAAGVADRTDGTAARALMFTVNGAIVAMGIFNAVGLLWLRGETRWLREYLRQRRDGGST